MNSPMTWIQKSIDHYIDPKRPNKDTLYKKLLLVILKLIKGIPFHGFVIDRTGDKPKGFPIDGKKLIEFLSHNKDGVLKWDNDEKEHSIDYSQKDKLFVASFPTIKVKLFLKCLVFKRKN